MTKPLSPSEVETARRCWRLWAAKYNSDWERVESEVSARAGTALHALAEDYLARGVAPQRHDAFGELFIEGLPHLPAPFTGVCEGRIEGKLFGLPFVMVQDWRGPSDALPNAPRGLPATLDHKTSLDPKVYGNGLKKLTRRPGDWRDVNVKAQFLDNPQTLIYLARHDASEAFGRWLYYKKSTAILAWELEQYRALGCDDPVKLEKMERRLAGPRRAPKAVPSDVVLTREEIRGGLERIVLPLGEKLYRLREKGKLDPLTLEPNPAECDAFGGCPHKKRCNLSTYEIAKGAFKSMTTNSAPQPPQFSWQQPAAPAPAPAPQGVPQFNPAAAAPAFNPNAAPAVQTPQFTAPVNGPAMPPQPGALPMWQGAPAPQPPPETLPAGAIPLQGADLARYKTDRLVEALRAAFEAFVSKIS